MECFYDTLHLSLQIANSFYGIRFWGIRAIAHRGKLSPLLGLEFGLRSGLVLGLGGNQAIVPPRKIAPVSG